MTKRTILGLLASTLLCFAVGCGESPPSEAEAAVSELNEATFPGTYESEEEVDEFFSSVKVVAQGNKLAVEIDGESHPLARTASGAHVFTTGDMSGDCDNPGCSFMTRISGVLFFKKVGNGKQAQLKLTVREEHPHPEFEGDIEGETTTTVRWIKK